MKKIISIALAALVVIAGASSCKNDKKAKGSNSYSGEVSYVNAIPADAAMVFKLDAGKIIEQSDILNNDVVRDIAGGDASGEAGIVMNVLQNPAKFGVNIDNPMFLAYAGGERGVLVASVVGEKLSSIVSLAALSGSFVVETEGDTNYLRLDRDALAAFNGNTAVLLFGNLADQTDLNPKDYVAGLLSQESTSAKEGFDRFINNDAPIALWAEYESLYDCLRPLRKHMTKADREQFDIAMSLMKQYDLKDTYLLSTISFTEKGISLDTYQVASDSMMSFSMDHIAKMDPEMLEYLPKDASFAFTLNLNDLEGMLEKSFALVKDSDDTLKDMEEALESMGLTLADVPQNFAAAVAPLNNLKDIPSFTVVCKASPKFYNAVSEYSAMLGDDVVMSYNNGYMTLMAKQLSYFSKNGRPMENMSDSPYAELMKSSIGGAMVIDLKNVDLRRVMSDAGLDRNTKDLAMDFLKLLKNVTFSAEINGNEGHTNLSIGVNTHGNNALKTIIDKVVDVLMDGFNTPDVTIDEFEF